MKKSIEFDGKTEDEVAKFIVEARLDFKAFRKVVLKPEGTTIVDLNRSEIRFPGIAYGHPLLETVLREAGASFDKQTVHDEPPNEEKRREFRCSARYAWGQDRIA